jgi:hypothetical protein
MPGSAEAQAAATEYWLTQNTLARARSRAALASRNLDKFSAYEKSREPELRKKYADAAQEYERAMQWLPLATASAKAAAARVGGVVR